MRRTCDGVGSRSRPSGRARTKWRRTMQCAFVRWFFRSFNRIRCRKFSLRLISCKIDTAAAFARRLQSLPSLVYMYVHHTRATASPISVDPPAAVGRSVGRTVRRVAGAASRRERKAFPRLLRLLRRPLSGKTPSRKPLRKGWNGSRSRERGQGGRALK